MDVWWCICANWHNQVVEIMNSAGEMFLTSGDSWYADRLEQIAYNALPAAFMNGETELLPSFAASTVGAVPLRCCLTEYYGFVVPGTMWSLNYFQQVNKL